MQYFASLSAWALAAALSAPALASVPIAPQYAGSFDAGAGADASFYQIDSSWHGSTVLWDEATGTYGSGLPIGSYGWGTGLWGQADWQAVQNAAAGTGGAGAPTVINAWSGIGGAINYGNALYNSDYSSTWGPATIVPFFDPASTAPQENWTAHFTGFIRITTPGEYNFGVLNDDGFFLRLTGAGGTSLEIGRDFLNPRERNGFSDTLLLSEGLYGFELGMWNREEAGVVDLRWLEPGSTEWTLVPVTSLLPVSAVPEAPTALLAVLGLAFMLPVLRRQRTRS